MPYTPEELAFIEGTIDSPFSSIESEPPEENGGIVRTGKQILNIVPKSLNVMGRKWGEAAQFFHPDMDLSDMKESASSFVPTFDTGARQGMWDVVMEDVLPEVPAMAAEFLIPYGAVRGTLRAIGGASKLSSVLAEGFGQSAGAVSGLHTASDNLGKALSNPVVPQQLKDLLSNTATAGDNAALGFAGGVAQEALPRWQRLGPLAAISAAYYAKTGDVLGAGLNMLNILPGAFKRIDSTTTPRLNPSKFDNLLNESQSMSRFESPQNPGEFNFMGEVPVSSPRSFDATGDLFNQSPMQFDRSPFQPELRLEPNLSSSELRLNHFDDPLQSPLPIQEFSNSGLSLRGGQYVDQPLSPLVDLQSQGRGPSAPYQFLEETPIRPIDTTGDLFAPKIPEQPITPHPEFEFNGAPKVPAESLFSSIEAQIHAQHASAPAWTKPGEGLPGGFTQPAFKYGSTFKTPEQVAIAHKQADMLSQQGMKLLDEDIGNFDKAQELISKGQYLKEAAEYAEGLPSKVELFRKNHDPNYKPSVPGEAYNKAFPAKVDAIPQVEIDLTPALWDKVDNEILAQGSRGVTKHADIKDTAIDRVAWKRDDFDPFDDIVHGFIDEGGKQLSRVEAGAKAIEGNLLNVSGLAKAELAKKTGKPFSLDSQDLKIAEPKGDLVAAKNLQDRADNLRQDALMAMDEGKPESAASLNRIADSLEQKAIAAATGMKRGGSQAGSISPETAAIIGAGGLAALVAYKESEGDIGTTLAAGVLAAGLGIAGVKGIKALKTSTGPKASPATASKPIPDASIKEKLKNFARDTTQTPGGFAVMGRGGIWANAVRMAEGMAGLHMSHLFRDKKILAEGFISDQLEVLQHAIDSVKNIKPSAAFSDASARFLRGQLADKVTVENIIRNGGGHTGKAWDSLPASQKRAYPEKWIVMDDPKNTNTKGPGVTVYHVTNSIKKTLVDAQRKALTTHVTGAADQEFMRLAITSRDTIDNLMGVVHLAVPPGERLNKILGTMGQYTSRSHELLTNPKYYPTDVEIGMAMDRLSTLREQNFLDAIPINSGSGATIVHKGKTYSVSPQMADEFNNLYTPEELRSVVGQYIKEIKTAAAGQKVGLLSKDTEQLGSSIFTGRKELDEVTQALLGTHQTTAQMVQQTVNRLVPSARAAHFMKDLIQLTDEATGLKMSFKSSLDYNKAINSLKDTIAKTTDPRVLKDLETRLQELSSYIPVSGHQPKMGLFQGAYVSRSAYDQLAGFDNPFGLLDNSIGRGLASFNQVIKETHLVANPIVHVRNMLQIPFFLSMGNAAASPAAWKSAYDAMRNPLSSIGRRLTQNGVFIGNVVQGEFKHSLQELLDGSADKTIWNTLKKGREAAHTLYAMPDNFVRAAVYLAAEQKAAKKFKVSVDVADPRVTQEARMFMSRRTMDYANVPQWVKTGRQIPMVSMFLSYTHEIMRISGNLAADAMKGDLAAGATLAGIASLPFLLQSQAENDLSPEDLAQWNSLKKTAQDYSRPRFKLPLSRNKNGTFNYMDITPLFPMNDFQMMARSAAKGDFESVAAINPFVGLEKTPLLSIISEQITGKERHTAKEFRDGWDRILSIAQEIAPPHTPGIGNEWNKSMPEELGGKLGQTNLKTGRTNTIKGSLLRHLSGVDYTQVSPSIATANAIKAAQHQIANEKQYLRDVMLTSEISDEAKKRAQKRYIEAVYNITSQLESRLP